jgi:hypothetical protein
MKIAFALFAALVAIVVLASSPAPADTGSCYSPRPVCIVGTPTCYCTPTMQCYWVCR